jgi:hypothetical protein
MTERNYWPAADRQRYAGTDSNTGTARLDQATRSTRLSRLELAVRPQWYTYFVYVAQDRARYEG